MPSTIQALKRDLTGQVSNLYKLNTVFHASLLWKQIPDKLMPRQYLKTKRGLVRDTTLEELWSPGSPHLLDHPWERVERPGQEACRLFLGYSAFLTFLCRFLKLQVLNLANPPPKSAKPRNWGQLRQPFWLVKARIGSPSQFLPQFLSLLTQTPVLHHGCRTIGYVLAQFMGSSAD
jgi:hypothetical protein